MHFCWIFSKYFSAQCAGQRGSKTLGTGSNPVILFLLWFCPPLITVSQRDTPHEVGEKLSKNQSFHVFKHLPFLDTLCSKKTGLYTIVARVFSTELLVFQKHPSFQLGETIQPVLSSFRKQWKIPDRPIALDY